MHWTEPTTWKRVKDNAREIARGYRWRRIGALSGALTLAICLCVRFPPPVVWTVAAIWQVAWIAFVFGVGRLSRHDPEQNSRT